MLPAPLPQALIKNPIGPTPPQAERSPHQEEADVPAGRMKGQMACSESALVCGICHVTEPAARQLPPLVVLPATCWRCPVAAAAAAAAMPQEPCVCPVNTNMQMH